jgi:hypothetical protein
MMNVWTIVTLDWPQILWSSYHVPTPVQFTVVANGCAKYYYKCGEKDKPDESQKDW